MTTLREAVAQALDALTKIHPANMSWETGDAWMNAVQILREALSQPEPKPLTDEEITALVLEWWCPTMVTAKDRKFVRAIERAHGIGGEE